MSTAKAELNASNGSRDLGITAVMELMASGWLYQNGLQNVVATMGADCSERQAELIVPLVQPGGRAWMLTDGDPAGGPVCAFTLRQSFTASLRAMGENGRWQTAYGFVGEQLKAQDACGGFGFGALNLLSRRARIC